MGSMLSTLSRTSAKTDGRVARSTLSRTSLLCTTWPWRSSSPPLRSATSKRSVELPLRQSPHNKETNCPRKKIHLNKNQQAFYCKKKKKKKNVFFKKKKKKKKKK